MVGSICASIVEERTEDLAAGAYRYCPTSFVSRICTQPTAIGDVEFKPGDICYVSLMPASDETGDSCPEENGRSPSLAFGLGIHTCIGKHLSLAVLAIAQDILHEVFSEGFEKTSMLAPEGTFLAFKD
jgi:hypothetical protein